MVSHIPAPSVYETQINALGQFLQILRGTSNNLERVKATVAYLKKEVQPSLIWMGLFDEERQYVHYIGGAIDGEEATHVEPTFPIYASDLLDQVLIHQKPIGVPNLSREASSPQLMSFARQLAIQGCGFFPIRDHGNCRGVLILGWRHQDLSLSPECLSCFSIAFKELGARLDRFPDTGELLSYKSCGSLPDLLEKICGLSSLESAIETITLEIQSQVKPIETRVFWLNPQSHTFFLVSSASTTLQPKKNQNNASIAARELGKFHLELQSGQSVTLMKGTWISAGLEHVLCPSTYQSALLTPILSASRLLGFIVTSTDVVKPLPEITQAFLKSASNLIALGASKLTLKECSDQQAQPLDVLQSSLQLLTRVDQGPIGLKQLAFHLCQALHAKHFSLVHYDPESKEFGISYQLTAQRRQLLPAHLGGLIDLDWELIAQSEPIFSIGHWNDDLRLLNWRPHFTEIGVQSLLGCRLRWGEQLEGLLLIGHDTPRLWNLDEQRLLSHMAEPIGWLVHQWKTRQQQGERQRLSESVLLGIAALQQVKTLGEFNQAVMQWVGQTSGPAMAALMTWLPGQTTGKFAAVYPQTLTGPIEVGHDFAIDRLPLLADILRQEELTAYAKADLPAGMQDWLQLAQTQYLFAIALRPALTQVPIGVLWVGVRQLKDWTEERLKALQCFVQEAAAVQHRLITHAYTVTKQTSLEQLNWYKLQKLEPIGQQLAIQTNWLIQQEPTFIQGTEQTSTPQLLKSRYQAMLQSLDTMNKELANLMGRNAWKLQSVIDKILLPSFLKSALERLNPLSSKCQLWTQVHSLPDDSPAAAHQIFIQGDISNFKLTLDDVLVAACHRSPQQGRIDLWPRLLDHQWLELSITDQGVLDADLLQELAVGRVDLLTPSKLDEPLGRQLWICQQFMRDLSGDLAFYQLDDGRVLTRLVYPITLKT